MTGVDTNVLVRYFLDDDPSQADRVEAFIRECAAKGDQVFVSCSVSSPGRSVGSFASAMLKFSRGSRNCSIQSPSSSSVMTQCVQLYIGRAVLRVTSRIISSLKSQSRMAASLP